jgi:hypothetical protein
MTNRACSSPPQLIIVAYYLVFVSLYGMKEYAWLAGALVVVGTVGIHLLPAIGAVSGWLGAAVFLVFTPILYRNEKANPAAS